MIFPSESVLDVRGKLEDRISAGEIDEVQAYREALAADPMDPRALRVLALFKEDEDNYAEALELAWRWLRADPLSHEAFLLIGRMLARDPAQVARARAYRALGQEKLHFDPDAESEYVPPVDDSGEPEPTEVGSELEPHRLLHKLWLAGPEELSRQLVDAVLARGADIGPLLIGVLNLYAEDLLNDVDDALVARALSLLGEIDTPDLSPALYALHEFSTLKDENVSAVSDWALRRIASRRPADLLAWCRTTIPTAGAFLLSRLAQDVVFIPATEGREAALEAVLARLPQFDRKEQGIITLAALVSADLMQGADPRFAAEIEARHGRLLTNALRRDREEFRRSFLGAGGGFEDDVTIYDMVCQHFEPVEDDDHPFVRAEPKIGRNDPCWCGSGKKYKKCHLAADESR